MVFLGKHERSRNREPNSEHLKGPSSSNAGNLNNHSLQPLVRHLVSKDSTHAIRVPKFDNKTHVIQWLDEYEYTAKANNWSADQMAKNLPQYLEGEAQVWYRTDIESHGSELA